MDKDKIEQLDKLQASKNQGRGVGCVQTLIVYLRMGDLKRAKACFFNEYDKISSNPDIKELLLDILGIEDPDVRLAQLLKEHEE